MCMMESSKKSFKYEEWVDILKGILIIFVVIGHGYYYSINSVIFWFHMPVFYFISGYLLKIPNKIDISNLCKKQCKTLLIPYGVTPVK